MDKELLWLLAQLFVVLRRGYITSHLADVYGELAAQLAAASGIDVLNADDETVLDHFNPAQSEPESSHSSEEAKG